MDDLGRMRVDDYGMVALATGAGGRGGRGRLVDEVGVLVDLERGGAGAVDLSCRRAHGGGVTTKEKEEVDG